MKSQIKSLIINKEIFKMKQQSKLERVEVAQISTAERKFKKLSKEDIKKLI